MKAKNKKRYFYSKENGEYVGSTNTSAACPGGCIVSNAAPDKQPSRDELLGNENGYAGKVAEYSDRQIHGALIRAKNPKRDILLSERARRES